MHIPNFCRFHFFDVHTFPYNITRFLCTLTLAAKLEIAAPNTKPTRGNQTEAVLFAALHDMPKGMKVRTTGVAVYWFECSCGYRWEGDTQSAKLTAHRLHSKKCASRPIYSLHTDQRPIALHKESKTAAIDARIKELQEGTVGQGL